jgi:hypothetical protein
MWWKGTPLDFASIVVISIVTGITIVTVFVLAIPLLAIWAHHKRKLEETRLGQRVRIAKETRAAIESLREELKSLRDTTTAYDLSFDTALQRLESRMTSVEQRIAHIEKATHSLLGLGANG